MARGWTPSVVGGHNVSLNPQAHESGHVYAGYWKDTIEVVIKELKMNPTDEFIKESEAMKKLNHERLLMLYG